MNPLKGGTSWIFRVEVRDPSTSFSVLAGKIGEMGADIMAVDLIHSGTDTVVRDITMTLPVPLLAETVTAHLATLPGVRVVNASDRTFLSHLGGKIEITPKVPVKNRDDLSRVYTPGVARVAMAIHDDPDKIFRLTIKRNTVAVVTDGSAVLGLGNVGPGAALPVMEGKALLFKSLAGVDAFPICLNTQDADEIVRIVENIAPVFGGINLEDISSPRCFDIEERLKKSLDIPVFHDDQHGTAVVLAAGLMNALKIVGKEAADLKVVVAGIGAAGVACTKMLWNLGVTNVVGFDRSGILNAAHPEGLPPVQRWYAEQTNHEHLSGDMSVAIKGADVFIGVSGPGVLNVEHLKSMARDPIVFAMANPQPEIDPYEALPHVRILATGGSDFPNQVNNVLCFPGIFRGALDCRASQITEEMKLAAARAIADSIPVDELTEEYIIPGVFNRQVVTAVRDAVLEAAYASGVARREVGV